jgi:uncharacterized protein DUF1320
VATTPYLDRPAFKLLTIAPASYVDEIHVREPGWIDAQLIAASAWINSRLSKRYDAPFASPYPEAVTLWLSKLVTYALYLKRGVDQTDEQFDDIKQQALDAQVEIKEAADNKDGLFDLPLRADTVESGITRGGPLGYSEVSPYTWSRLQAEAAEDE